MTKTYDNRIDAINTATAAMKRAATPEDAARIYTEIIRAEMAREAASQPKP